MKIKRPVFSIILILLFCQFKGTPPLSGLTEESAVRRFGIFIGSNYGGPGRSTLLYASSDAEKFSQVLYEMGGLEGGDSILLIDPNPAAVKSSFIRIQNRIKIAKRDSLRVEFLFYYSGHSDEKGLLLGTSGLPFMELKKEINAVGADVNIAVLDSCYSGTFTRLKGGTRKPPFMLDQSVETKGHAFLTSSSADEAAQESDALGASFFTHYFISGLRGAADSNRDGKITLHEAHAYAASETLIRTSNSQAGPQHPSYDINLSGSGDLVLTDLRSTSAQILLDQNMEGRLFIRDHSNRLVTELRKDKGLSISIALPPGDYQVTLDYGQELFQTSITLANNSRMALGMQDFTSAFRDLTRVRGDSQADKDDYYMHFYSSISPVFSFPESDKRAIVHILSLGLFTNAYSVDGISLGFINLLGGDLKGGQFSPFFNILGRNMTGFQGGGIFNVVNGSVTGTQLAGIFNIAGGDVSFFQGAGIFNVSGNKRGIQAAGIFNISGFNDGFQGAGIFNISRGGKGFQGAGIFNITEDYFEGFQGSGIFNASSDLKGFQLSLLNFAKDVKGVQFGLLNAGRDVNGTQVGLININRDITGMPFGLINISARGLHNLSVYSDEKGFTYMGFQFGTKNLYSFFFGGVDSDNPSGDLAAGAGMGIHFTAGGVYLDCDFSAKHLVPAVSWENKIINFFNFGTQTFPSIRLSLGVSLAKNFSIFGGVLFDGLISGITNPTRFHEGSPAFVIPLEMIDTNISAYSRWFFGIRL